MRFRIGVVVGLLALAALLAIVLVARPKGAPARAPVAVSEDGAKLYATYCSSCHGAQGRGDGKAVSYLRIAVPDLTRIAERAGKFDSEAVSRTIIGQEGPPYHQMPGWDAVFSSIYATPEQKRVAVEKVVRYIEKMQTSH